VVAGREKIRAIAKRFAENICGNSILFTGNSTLTEKIAMNKKWPMVPLREVLTSVNRPELVDPEKTYHILGAHWYAK
jgi:hypothetical protein